jgi:hypothetical protein
LDKVNVNCVVVIFSAPLTCAVKFPGNERPAARTVKLAEYEPGFRSGPLKFTVRVKFPPPVTMPDAGETVKWGSLGEETVKFAPPPLLVKVVGWLKVGEPVVTVPIVGGMVRLGGGVEFVPS